MPQDIKENKLNSIEEALAYQEQQIQDLSEMVVRQSGDINALKKRLLKLQDQIGTSGTQEGEGLSPADITARDKPPHY